MNISTRIRPLMLFSERFGSVARGQCCVSIHCEEAGSLSKPGLFQCDSLEQQCGVLCGGFVQEHLHWERAHGTAGMCCPAEGAEGWFGIAGERDILAVQIVALFSCPVFSGLWDSCATVQKVLSVSGSVLGECSCAVTGASLVWKAASLVSQKSSCYIRLDFHMSVWKQVCCPGNILQKLRAFSGMGHKTGTEFACC